jgi:hypothetical protein
VQRFGCSPSLQEGMEQVNVLMEELTDMVGSLSWYTDLNEYEALLQQLKYQEIARLKELIIEQSINN